MVEKIVIGGPASQELAASMAKRMNARLLSPDVTEFADGETRIKFNEKVDGAKAIL
ncbi:MAG: ribose-phosphate pyrophosphokinase-like domain-containing protein, partial [Thaumarchaeota archaeon]|nr:ribose-phosphate pyrophosphokinase-like domain-containing protein [Nitrososphaerota archaeon]